MSLGVGGIVSVGGSTGSGGGGSTSGIQIINPGNNVGPTVSFEGVNGVQVTSPSANVILIDGAGASGAVNLTKFIAVFTDQVAVTGIHNIGTEDVLVQVYDTDKKTVFPDEIEIIDITSVAIRFNAPQSGKVVIIG